MAIYLMGTSTKGVSSTKLSNDLEISRKSAWFLAHRIRRVWKDNAKEVFGETVEADETYIGGFRKRDVNPRKRAVLSHEIKGSLNGPRN